MAETGRTDRREGRHRHMAAFFLVSTLGALFLSANLLFLEDRMWEAGSWNWFFLALASLLAIVAVEWRTNILGLWWREPPGRKVCRLSVEELLDLVSGKTDLQADEAIKPHLGTWLEMAGTVSGVSESLSPPWVTVAVNSKASAAAFHVKSKTLRNYCLSLKKGDRVAARGRLFSVSPTLIQIAEAEFI